MASRVGQKIQVEGYGKWEGRTSEVVVVGCDSQCIVLQFGKLANPDQTANYRFKRSDGRAVGEISENGFRIPQEVLRQFPAKSGQVKPSGTSAKKENDMAAATATPPVKPAGKTNPAVPASKPAPAASAAASAAASRTPVTTATKNPTTFPPTPGGKFRVKFDVSVGMDRTCFGGGELPAAPKGCKRFRIAHGGYLLTRDTVLGIAKKSKVEGAAEFIEAWSGAIDTGGWIYVYMDKARATFFHDVVAPAMMASKQTRSFQQLATCVVEEFKLKRRDDVKYGQVAKGVGAPYSSATPTGGRKAGKNGASAKANVAPEVEEEEEEEEAPPAPAVKPAGKLSGKAGAKK